MMDNTTNNNFGLTNEIEFGILKDKVKMFEEELMAIKKEFRHKNEKQDEKVSRLEDKVDSQLMKLIDLGHNMTRMELSMTHLSEQQILTATEQRANNNDQKENNKILLNAITGEFKRDKAYKRLVGRKWVDWVIGGAAIGALAGIVELIQKFM